MSRNRLTALTALIIAFGKSLKSRAPKQSPTLTTLTPTAPAAIYALEQQADLQTRDTLDRRAQDTLKIFNRKRNAHACIMSIVFIVLYPLGAISIHLPIARIPWLRNTYLVKKVPAIHAPIQAIGLVMMVGGLALGIKIASDLRYLSDPVHAHVVLGLIVVCTILLFQPILGVLQHRYFKRTGGKSAFGHVHRWIGRLAIILGIINNGLGLQLAERGGVDVPTGSWARNFGIAGVLGLIWLGLAAYDELRPRRAVESSTQKDVA